MQDLVQKLTETAHKLRRTGFFSVFGSNVLCKVFSFIGGMLVVRVLSKSDYGLYTYVVNCYGMLYLLYDLGCSVAAMQFCNENYNDPRKFRAFFSYGFRRGMTFLLLTSVLLLASPLFYPFRLPETARMTQWLFLVPLIDGVTSFLQVNLRIRLLNNRFAAVNLAATVINYLVILPMSYFWGLEGAVLSKYGVSILTLLAALWESRGEFPPLKRETAKLLSSSEKKSFLKLAFASQLNNGIDTGLMLLDVFLIGIFIAAPEVISSYKVATTIPSALAFVPSSVMVYVVPYFARHIQDRAWVRQSYFRLLKWSAIGNGIIALGGILLSGWIVPLIFGTQYADAIPCFRILMLSYFFSSTFRTPSANILYTQRKVRVILTITLLSGVVNCILDVVLILHLRSIGAAIATLLVHIITSAMSFGYLCHYLKGATE